MATYMYGGAKVGLQLQFIFVLLYINYCIILHINNDKPALSPLSVYVSLHHMCVNGVMKKWEEYV